MSEFNKVLNQKAVALSYDEEHNQAPVIVASGRGHMAERIVELACEHDVPVYEDHSLANILSQMELGSEIPGELYQMVVDIYVYFLKLVPDGAAANTQDTAERTLQSDDRTPETAADTAMEAAAAKVEK